MSNIDFTRLHEALSYAPDTGVFTWKSRVAKHIRIGTIAGYPQPNEGYIRIVLDKKSYYAHRLAWCYVYGVWPAGQLDHINRVKHDNRISNLRIATPTTNNLNKSGPRADNKSGFRGVVAHKCQWRADFQADGVQQYLGLFPTAEAAHAAYLKAKASRI